MPSHISNSTVSMVEKSFPSVLTSVLFFSPHFFEVHDHNRHSLILKDWELYIKNPGEKKSYLNKFKYRLLTAKLMDYVICIGKKVTV